MPEPKKSEEGRIDKWDALYVAGASLVSIGLLFDGPGGFTKGLVAAGSFCLFPVITLQLAAFIKGLKT
jgi:hypothetical protein